MQPELATIDIQTDTNQLHCKGMWTHQGITALHAQAQTFVKAQHGTVIIDGSDITQLDSAGAWLLHTLIQSFHQQGVKTHLQGFGVEKDHLISLVQEQDARMQSAGTANDKTFNVLARLGQRTCLNIQKSTLVFNFIGRMTHELLRMVYRPRVLAGRAILQIIEQNGYHALPIIALLSFLVGVVLAYQMGGQLKNYGANIYVVDLLGLSILREFGPLMTAIIVAGRTGSAYTAEIGTMTVNEEVDALKTMGVSPIQILAMPRIIGLLIALPLLTIWADLFGLLGGMVMSKSLLNISFYHFVNRFHDVVSFHTYYLGIIKVPVFALLIAGVGTYHGFQVRGGADSVGRETTKSVVHAIFLIIVADAIFSIIFGWKNI